jgi:hypothetical protein
VSATAPDSSSRDPNAACNPSAFRLRSGKRAESVPEFCLAFGIPQLWSGQIRSAREKVNVRVIEARQHPAASEIKLRHVLRLGAHNLLGCSQGGNSVPCNRDSLYLGLGRITRPDLSVHNH